jgi:hypothetical protein
MRKSVAISLVLCLVAVARTNSVLAEGGIDIGNPLDSLNNIVQEGTELTNSAKMAAIETLSADSSSSETATSVAQADDVIHNALTGLATLSREEHQRKRDEKARRHLRQQKTATKIMQIRTEAEREGRLKATLMSMRIKNLRASLIAVNAEENTQKKKLKTAKAHAKKKRLLEEAHAEAERSIAQAKKRAHVAARRARHELEKRETWARKTRVRLKAMQGRVLDVLNQKLTEVRLGMEKSKLHVWEAKEQATKALGDAPPSSH